jgi:hypothetical protein
MAIHIHGDDSEGVLIISEIEKQAVRDLTSDADESVWVIDEEEPLDPGILLSQLVADRKIELVRHRCKKINVSVVYNGIEEVIRVSPARKLRAVLRKALKIPEFGIDQASAQDLELYLPGADEALDLAMPVGRLVPNGKCELSIELRPAIRHAG